MRLTAFTADRLVDDLGTRLNGGALSIYSGTPPIDPNEALPFQEPLITIRFQSPAFAPARDGQAVAHDLPPTPVSVTGEATWAQLVTPTGEVVSDIRVRAVDAADAEEGDILVDRTDFHRGGLCTLTRVTVTLPLRP